MQDACEHQAYVWNYIDIGMNAKTAYGFDRLREKKPWLAAKRIANIIWYNIFACSEGWFCGSRPLNRKVRIGLTNRSLRSVQSRLQGAYVCAVPDLWQLACPALLSAGWDLCDRHNNCTVLAWPGSCQEWRMAAASCWRDMCFMSACVV